MDRFDIDSILKDEFRFINITKQVELSKAWNNKGLQHLWRYNLHYFEYLFKLAYEYTEGNNRNICYGKFKDLLTNWIDNNPFAYGDGWHPYTISLRITNWIATYQAFKKEIIHDNDFNKIFIDSLYLQYKYLQHNLEKDVLGNHYFENIKALIIGSIFFEDEKLKEKLKIELLKQLREQILEDGMHFELSPMYHNIVLEDLIKISYWLKDEDLHNILNTYIQKMINVTYSFEKNFGKTAAFNDSANGVSKEFECLLEVCTKYFELNPEENTSFENSGYYIIEDPKKKLIFDTGNICPAYLPAHGHCDALSFELSINGSPLIVNSGTYLYESGKWRDFFRSTKAHNTVSISAQEQSQFWGNFRVAKRIKKIRRKQFMYEDIQFYAGAYVSYNGAEHKRFVGHIDESTIIVLDCVNAGSQDIIQSHLHFVPGTSVVINKNFVQASNYQQFIQMTLIGTNNVNMEPGWYSKEFNVKEENNSIIFQKDETKQFFGYLLDFNSRENKIIEMENGLKYIGDKEQIINYDDLGAML